MTRRNDRLAARKSRGASSHRDGRLAERVAALFLSLKGYRILGTRVKTPFGEIDILAGKKGALIAVEVKRRGGDYAAHAAISPRQQRRLLNALQFAAGRQNPAPQSLRCDAILFGRANPWPLHVKNAFS